MLSFGTPAIFFYLFFFYFLNQHMKRMLCTFWVSYTIVYLHLNYQFEMKFVLKTLNWDEICSLEYQLKKMLKTGNTNIHIIHSWYFLLFFCMTLYKCHWFIREWLIGTYYMCYNDILKNIVNVFDITCAGMQCDCMLLIRIIRHKHLLLQFAPILQLMYCM